MRLGLGLGLDFRATTTSNYTQVRLSTNDQWVVQNRNGVNGNLMMLPAEMSMVVSDFRIVSVTTAVGLSRLSTVFCQIRQRSAVLLHRVRARLRQAGAGGCADDGQRGEAAE